MDLKQGMETLRSNKTFRCILQTLLSIGIFLNGSHVKGFQIEYLAKVPEVKDTVHKHSLLHHLCHMVMDKFPDSSDLYSEVSLPPAGVLTAYTLGARIPSIVCLGVSDRCRHAGLQG